MTTNIRFLSVDDVVEIHRILISRSLIKNESDSILNFGLLESAVLQPRQTFAGELLHPTIYDQAATYLYCIANNHAFENGNKRTAAASTISFLRLNNYRIMLSPQEFEQLVLDAVMGNKTKAEIANVFRKGAIQTIV